MTKLTIWPNCHHLCRLTEPVCNCVGTHRLRSGSLSEREAQWRAVRFVTSRFLVDVTTTAYGGYIDCAGRAIYPE